MPGNFTFNYQIETSTTAICRKIQKLIDDKFLYADESIHHSNQVDKTLDGRLIRIQEKSNRKDLPPHAYLEIVVEDVKANNDKFIRNSDFREFIASLIFFGSLNKKLGDPEDFMQKDTTSRIQIISEYNIKTVRLEYYFWNRLQIGINNHPSSGSVWEEVPERT